MGWKVPKELKIPASAFANTLTDAALAGQLAEELNLMLNPLSGFDVLVRHGIEPVNSAG